jgi:protein gp37
MAENSNISWCDSTFNPWRGCTRVSKGCQNCYAETLSKRNPKTMGVWGPQGTRVVASESMWREPLKWDRKANAEGVRHRVFCASLADVFEDWTGPEDDGAMTCHKTGEPLSINARGHVWPMGWPSMSDGDDWGCRPYTMNDVRKRLFDLIDRTPNLDWLLLTKRPENILRMMPPPSVFIEYREKRRYPGSSHAHPNPFPHTTRIIENDRIRDNVWIGTSVEDQQTADFRIPHLLRVPAKVRFLSMEPLIGPVDLRPKAPDAYSILGKFYSTGTFDPTGSSPRPDRVLNCFPKIHWVITGGESGDGFRDCDPKWQADIVEQCKGAGVAVFVKQDSGRLPGKQGRIPLAVWQYKEFPDCSPQNKPFTTEQGEK